MLDRTDLCYASITAKSGFFAISAKAAAADGSSFIIVTAYREGVYVGSRRHNLTSTSVSNLIFPPTWGVITELVIHPCGGSQFVLYGLNAAMVGSLT